MERIEFIMFKKYALMFLVSMVPLIELRGSIPIGLGMGLNPLWLYIICIVVFFLWWHIFMSAILIYFRSLSVCGG